MKRLIRVIAAIAFVFGLGATAVIASNPANAHTQTTASNICEWIEVARYGPNPNGIARTKCNPVHYWGSHQVDMRFSDGYHWYCQLYDIIKGTSLYYGYDSC